MTKRVFVTDLDGYDTDLPQREWFTLHVDDMYFQVYAYSPAKAVEYYKLWAKTPVEVNWIRRIPPPDNESTGERS